MEQIKEIKKQIFSIDDEIALLVKSVLPQYLIDIKWTNLLYERTELYNQLLKLEMQYDNSFRTA